MHMTRDSAWRQWKGAVRDLNRAIDRKDASRGVYLTVLFHEFETARAAAKEAGRDITSKTAMAEFGLPCVDCVQAYTEMSGHEIVEQAVASGSPYGVFARCGKPTVEPQ